MNTDRIYGDPIAELIAAIGTADFADRFLAAMRTAIRIDLCSAFISGSDGAMRLILSAGDHPRIPGFAMQASLDYARSYWRSDVDGQRLRGRQDRRRPLVVRQAASEISDPAYRHACYDRGGIDERITIHAAHGAPLFASGYRLKGLGAPSLDEVNRLESRAAILLAAAAAHDRVSRTLPELPDERGIAQQLIMTGLSAREAAVCAGLIMGRTHNEIGTDLHLAPTTIVTYRRRAYAKLGVDDHRALIRLYRDRVAGAH